MIDDPTVPPPADSPPVDSRPDSPEDAATVDVPPHDVRPDSPEDAAPVDLDAIERDLGAVEIALARLADGTYWTDEVTGDALSDALLERDPTARRA